MLKNNYKKYKQLRKDFVFFTFEGYFITDNPENLKIVYHFNLSDKFQFYPEIDIRKKSIINSLTSHQLESLVFHVGMIELISYWKAACPPKLIVKPFALNPEQIFWWKKIYFNGLGEFFYINNIKSNIEDFIEIISDSDKMLSSTGFNVDSKNVIVPVGGGKDSVVTLELLKDKYNVIPLIINPRGASLNTIKAAGFTDNGFVEINRTIHPQLLDLNEKGFLNGHTPFSALIAFVSIMTAALTGSRYIALSNESSANEPTDKESGVNHQYSKSFEFEKDFREYVAKFITADINYFSFLRPLNEMQIAKLFSGLQKYFQVFKSCNVGSKTDSWCGKCPKCLFTFIILSPFINLAELVNIFGKNMFQDSDLLTSFKELTGINQVKPFECVGTIDEVNLSIIATIKNYDDNLPYLLDYYKSTSNFSKYQNFETIEIFHLIDNNHFLNKEFLDILKSALIDK